MGPPMASDVGSGRSSPSRWASRSTTVLRRSGARARSRLWLLNEENDERGNDTGQALVAYEN
jgi:hypothetical protein